MKTEESKNKLFASPLIEKVSNWILGIGKDEVIKYGYVTIERENVIREDFGKVVLTVTDRRGKGRSIKISSVYSKATHKPFVTFSVSELTSGDLKLNLSDLFYENHLNCNQESLENIFYHIKKLHRDSLMVDDEHDKLFKEEKIKNFLDNF